MTDQVLEGLEDGARALREFYGDSGLTDRIAALESGFCNSDAERCSQLIGEEHVNTSVLRAALLLKEAAGRVNVVVHAVGVLLSLPHILDPGERVQSLSLGAGNTGKDFDLETDRRVAEFKFARWRPKANTIRQNQVFKDFFYLAEYEGSKRRSLYVVDKARPIAFLQKSGRAINSVTTRNLALRGDFEMRYGSRYRVVREYYEAVRDRVQIVDLLDIAPIFQQFEA